MALSRKVHDGIGLVLLKYCVERHGITQVNVFECITRISLQISK